MMRSSRSWLRIATARQEQPGILSQANAVEMAGHILRRYHSVDMAVLAVMGEYSARVGCVEADKYNGLVHAFEGPWTWTVGIGDGARVVEYVEVYLAGVSFDLEWEGQRDVDALSKGDVSHGGLELF